jgi:hypothetical protein
MLSQAQMQIISQAVSGRIHNMFCSLTRHTLYHPSVLLGIVIVVLQGCHMHSVVEYTICSVASTLYHPSVLLGIVIVVLPGCHMFYIIVSEPTRIQSNIGHQLDPHVDNPHVHMAFPVLAALVQLVFWVQLACSVHICVCWFCSVPTFQTANHRHTILHPAIHCHSLSSTSGISGPI